MTKVSTKISSPKLVKASARHLHIAPRKIRLAANLVRGMNVNNAIAQLEHLPKRASPLIIRLLKSAVANAKNNFSLNPDFLFIKHISVDMGRAMKRYFPRARGSAFLIKRKMSHLNVALEERKQGKAVKSRAALFKRREERDAAENAEKIEAVNKQEVREPKKQFNVKTDEQIKTSRIQQKRRLFDRRGGE